ARSCSGKTEWEDGTEMKTVWFEATIFLSLTLSGCAREQPKAPADIVIRNARVYTVEKEQPWAQAVAVRGGRIEWVGSNQDAQQYIAASTKVIDAGSRLMLPGFIDSHLHVKISGGASVLRI